MSEHFVIVPVWAKWVTLRESHSDERPFCQHETCLCHFDAEHMERHFVRPVALGQITIEQALARYGSRVSPETVLR